MAYLFNYGIIYPACADIFNVNLVELIELKAISPLNLIKLVFPDFSIDSVVDKVSSTMGGLIKQYMIWIMIATSLLLVLLPLTIIRLIPVPVIR